MYRLMGYYFPLLPPEVREKNQDGTMADNFLYRTYRYCDKVYPEGIWILELAAYKTDKLHGTYMMRVPNRTFDEGTTFYDHLEHYLCGWWLSAGSKNRIRYTWWDANLRGQRGRWVTKGRMDFEPLDMAIEPTRKQAMHWRWGYLFPQPRTGTQAIPTSFEGSFVRTSYQFLGKRITPHTLRYMWATWGMQVGLNEQELRSLAYAMGHSVTTLRQMYERCTPEEKLRPIFEAIDREWLKEMKDSSNSGYPPEDE